MFGKLAEAQQKAEEVKQKLAGIQVTGIAAGGKVTVTADGNKRMLQVQIDPSLMNPEQREVLQELIVQAIEHALEQAENVSGSEMKRLLGSMMPGIGNLFGK